MYRILNETDIPKVVQASMNEYLRDIEGYIQSESGMIFLAHAAMYVKTTQYRVMGGTYAKLPEWITNKEACLNIHNRDDKCFIWSVLGIYSSCR